MPGYGKTGYGTILPWGGIGSNPKIVLPTRLLTAYKLRIHFSKQMEYNSDLINLSNYTVTPNTTNGVPINLLSIEAENLSNPTYVEINCSEYTNGEIYNISVEKLNGPKDLNGFYMDPNQSPFQISGIGIIPTVETLVATSKNTFELTFSENMFENSFIKDISNYSFDKSLLITNMIFTSNVITLITTDQEPGELYTLTITTE
ncbi:MAG: hypothetical protein BV456_06850 [Thermoplasmata archaeon M8B2D]|nr:MAG: hypothetical protein BV456_06850 [Thermoplasmata archaeon M8B2D]